MAHRVARLANHINANTSSSSSSSSSSRDNDVVIIDAIRTPLCKAKRGGFATTTPDLLLSQVLKAIIDRNKLSPNNIQDICVGNVLQAGGGAVMARMAQFEAEIPETVSLSSVNRQCSSGLQAIANIYGAIKAGSIDAGIGAGVESMSFNSMSDATPTVDFETVSNYQLARDCMIPMGITSENVAEKYGITRDDQDSFAERSHARASAAQASGEFKDEIIPTQTKEGKIITQDDGVRAGTTKQSLSKLQPAFKEGGSTTAGNSSQMTDGAAAVLLMRRSYAEKLGLKPIGVLRSFSVVGVPPDIMGIGPAVAIPAAIKQANLTINDISVFEINEAFASQAVYCVRELGLESSLNTKHRINPLGGAIALGHPLGCTGARQTATLLHYMKRHNLRYGIVSMCIGTGMGAAAVYERED